ncbi:MAG: hypothetical protein KDD67_03825 [Ignavibacteriae bacterium]|nr:hypothetical protein [Ignavibacteriota bacterium]MCB9215029.1 hypothetical protein [Ignavibacteria bacterium]
MRKLLCPIEVGLGLLLATILLSCGPIKEPQMEQGGLYTVEDGEGTFRPAKILAFDSSVVHLRLYCNTLSYRPDTVVADTLRLVAYPGEPVAREHFPVSRQLFLFWLPERVGFDSVHPDERALVGEWENSERVVVGE